MCGIVGVVDPSLDSSRLEASLRLLHHRGPDGSGVFLEADRHLGLGHARLSIIDLKTGTQPLYSHDGRVVLVCNGEIYDFERQRGELEREGYRFASHSDSDLIIHLYLKHGERFYEHLRGEFAFLLYDRLLGRLIAARDRFGIKPLYVVRTKAGGWAFSSEIKGLFGTRLVEREIDINAPRNGGATLFRGVEHVPPAAAIVLDVISGTPRVITYWRPDFPRASRYDTSRTFEEYKEEIDRVLTEAIRLRLRADVPVGLYLSGGIDSALIAAKVKTLVPWTPHAFTIAFVDEGGPYNEAEIAKLIARYVGVEHHVLEATTEALLQNLERCLWHVEAPLGDLAPVGKYLLSELAQRHVKVVLTGEGADEVFLGYNVFRQDRDGDGSFSSSRRALVSARFSRLLGRLLVATPKSIHARVLPEGQGSWSDSEQIEGRVPVVQLQYRRLVTHLPRVILCAYGDRTEMAHSIEGRVPFLDHRLFEVARDVPVEHKIRGGVEKYIIRKIADGLIPKEVVERRKWPLSTHVPSMLPGKHAGLDRLLATYASAAALRRAGIYRIHLVRILRFIRAIPVLPRAIGRTIDRVLFRICCVQILHAQFIADDADQFS
ncbi:MAG TPA: asparagine synthase (glutamine-hydrolyzing) [Candidatus Binatia bacterium]